MGEHLVSTYSLPFRIRKEWAAKISSLTPLRPHARLSICACTTDPSAMTRELFSAKDTCARGRQNQAQQALRPDMGYFRLMRDGSC